MKIIFKYFFNAHWVRQNIKSLKKIEELIVWNHICKERWEKWPEESEKEKKESDKCERERYRQRYHDQ